MAVAAAKLGAKTAFIGKAGNDAFGTLLADTLEANGVYTGGFIRSDDNTTLAVVSVDAAGERSFAFYRKGFADTLLTAEDCDIMLHAYMLTQSGIPVIYSGDEIAQLNDESYHDNPDQCADSRYLHRGKFNWQLVQKRKNPATVQGKVYRAVTALEACRRAHTVFTASAAFTALPTGSSHVLGILRTCQNERLYAYFNFSDAEQEAFFDEILTGVDLLSGKTVCGLSATLQPYGFLWLLCQ